jgi:peptide/nickel transport system permease protein
MRLRLILPAVVFLCVSLVSFFPRLIAKRDPLEIDAARVLISPGSDAWLGTDRLGRDLFSRLLHGGQVSLSVALGSVMIALAIGGVIGIISGAIGGKVDLLLMRFVDLFLSFPAFLLAITLAAALGPNARNASIGLAIVYAPIFARVVRSATIAEVSKGYCEALETLGVSSSKATWRHILPNISTPVSVQTTAAVAQALLIESGLSFLGLGSQPPAASWGSIISEGRVLLELAPWVVLGPSVMLSVTVLSLFLLGDSLREILDPRSR